MCFPVFPPFLSFKEKMTDIVPFEYLDAEQQDILLTAMKNSGMSL